MLAFQPQPACAACGPDDLGQVVAAIHDVPQLPKLVAKLFKLAVVGSGHLRFPGNVAQPLVNLVHPIERLVAGDSSHGFVSL